MSSSIDEEDEGEDDFGILLQSYAVKFSRNRWK